MQESEAAVRQLNEPLTRIEISLKRRISTTASNLWPSLEKLPCNGYHAGRIEGQTTVIMSFDMASVSWLGISAQDQLHSRADLVKRPDDLLQIGHEWLIGNSLASLLEGASAQGVR
jgi:hypothetical protein